MAKGCWGPNKIGEPIDTKFTFSGLCLEHGDSVDQNHGVLFLAKDAALPVVLEAYLDRCIELGAGEAQLDAVRALIARVTLYQNVHGDLVKVPDYEPPAGS